MSSEIVFDLADRLKGFEAPTVWEEFTPLAKQYQAVNLGQGFPDWPTPQFCKDAAQRALGADYNQYCRSGGLPELVSAISRRYSPLLGRELDALKEVTVSVGVSEGLFAAIHSIVNPEDEVILLEPAFDIYSAQIRMAGGVPVYVPLHPPSGNESSWHLNYTELKAAFSPRTRALILNTPHNPTGKVFKRRELEQIAEIIKELPKVTVISDEVYENLVYEGYEHIRIATLPGMWERTLTLSSAGKTFSVTGWKIGWLIGHERLIKGVMICNQWVQYSIASPLQRAVADMLDQAVQPYKGHPSYYAWLLEQYKRKRQLLVDALTTAGLRPLLPEGGFFIVACLDDVRIPDKYLQERTPAAPVMTRDWAFCRYLAMEVGVVAIPTSAFYVDEHKHLAAQHVRFAFCKTDEAIQEAEACFKRKKH